MDKPVMTTPEEIDERRRNFRGIFPGINDDYGKALGYDKFNKDWEKLRTFETGATRSPLGNKIQYEGYLNPLVIKRFGEYMRKHQTQSDGTQRDADNWQQGIPKNSLIDSGWRHFQDWWLWHRGYTSEMSEEITESLCALIFNAMAYMLQIEEEKLEGKDDPMGD